MADKIGDLIKQRIVELGYTQKEVGLKIHRSQKTIQSILRVKSIGTQRLLELCEALDYNFFEFFTRVGGPLERFAPESCDELRKENEDLKERNARLENEIAQINKEINHLKEVLVLMKQTNEMQDRYIKGIDSLKSKQDKK